MSSSSDSGQDGSTDQAGTVRRELDRLRSLARRISPDELRRGTWLAQLVAFALDDYVREVDAEWFGEHYPGQPPEAVIRARIQRAARAAGLEGGISAGAYTAAVAATLGSDGAASPLTLPAAGASFVLDLLFTAQLQLRLAHDVAVLSGVPLDLADPEDLWKLIRTAFGAAGRAARRGAVGKGVPVLVRPVVARLLRGGGAAAATRSLPVLGRYLLQRHLLTFSLPAVGVPLSVAVNHWSTRVAGAHAATVFGAEGRIVAAARQMTTATRHHTELLRVLWLIIKADALISENERLLLRHVTALVGDLDTELAAIAGLGSTLDLDQRTLWSMLAAASGDLRPLYDAGVVAAAVDGTINPNELANLRKLARYCSAEFDEDAIRAAARRV